MSTARTRRIAAASTMLIALAGLSACGTSGSAATSQQYQPAVGANLRSGDVQMYNALLVADKDGTLAFSAGLLNTTNTAQTLEGATITLLDGSATVDAKPAVDVELVSDQLYTIGRTGELAGIDGADLPAGLYAKVTLTFSDAGEFTIEAPIVARSSIYDAIASTPPADAQEEQAEQQEQATQEEGEENALDEDQAGA